MIKRLLSALICVFVLAASCPAFAYAEDMTAAQKIEYYRSILGDVDRNGEVDVSDARTALRIAVGLETDVSAEAEESADLDASGDVAVDDARNILRCAVGLSGFDIPVSKDDVVEYYVETANKVKQDYPGFSGKYTSVCPTIKVSIPLFLIKDEEMRDLLEETGQEDKISEYYGERTQSFIASAGSSRQHIRLFTVMGKTWSSMAEGNDVVSAKISYFNGVYSIDIEYGEFKYTDLPDDMTELEYGRMFDIGDKEDYTEADMEEGSEYQFESVAFKNGSVICNVDSAENSLKDVTFFYTSVLDGTLTDTADFPISVEMNTVITSNVTLNYVMKSAA